MNDVYMSKSTPILDSEGNNSGWYKQIVSKVNAINGNVRLYPKDVYGLALDELKQEGFPNAGEHPHPPQFKDSKGNIKFKTTIKNSAVKFRDAYIDCDNNVWAEFKILDTDMGRQVKEFIDNDLPFGFSNRMTGETVKRKINNTIVDVAKKLKLFGWDIVLNPAEHTTFGQPIPITDEILEKLKKEDTMDFFNMSLEELLKWKEENKESEDIELCDKIIEIKQNLETANEKIKVLNDEKEKQETMKLLEDELQKFNCNEAAKKLIKENGNKLTKKDDVKSFIESQKAIIDAMAIDDKLSSLGYNNGKKAATMEGEDKKEYAIVDNLMLEMDKALLKKDSNFRIDKDLRKANRAIIDEVMQHMKRNSNEEYKNFMRALTDETDSTVSDTGKFVQSASVSLAVLYQAWQDSKFLQLCLSESFSGTTYKMPVEFQSHDLFSEDDFTVDELESIPTEGVQTFLLEFGARWLKRGFVVTKEAEKELNLGPLRYDVIAANTASIANRFTRIIDRMISTEMLARADEYEAKRVENEVVKPSEFEKITAGINAPKETNAAFKVKLLCGNTSPISAFALIPPIVRPRSSVWLDTKGRKQQDFINPIIVKDSGWISSKGIIKGIKGKEAQYAVDYENSCIYFTDGSISADNLPTISYSYATNIAFFDLAIPKALEDFPARYYNKLVELIDVQKAYMAAAPRYVTPDFVLGSICAMLPIKQSELFYQRALPEGTSLLSGEGYFAKRNGIDFGEHNSTWAAGDRRLLLGKRNAVRVGMGSPYELEGPFPHMGKTGYTSAKEYFATQQIAINTPLVIDENGRQYNPPFRTIKYYNMG